MIGAALAGLVAVVIATGGPVGAAAAGARPAGLSVGPGNGVTELRSGAAVTYVGPGEGGPGALRRLLAGSPAVAAAAAVVLSWRPRRDA
ncbi:hypothetical protein [Amycolatopsis granulosa]|uniref:hypothetical protein n=1 Tax=Amycolatopsis granulosa TaxID=185684 RepID=UPI0014240C2F|nr:hypothetical protein [Amycolatopsis granulosa]NIH84024.1 chemotaxis response regulator CheB [Amycolatopsis granulosa]